MFFFNKSKIVVDCFTPFSTVYDFYKIDVASKFFPKEIQEIEKYYIDSTNNFNIKQEHGTIKTCVALQELYRNGAIIPLWTDVIFEPKQAANRESALAMVTPPFTYQTHDRKQYTGLFDNSIHLKLNSPWKLVEKSGVKFSWQAPVYNLHKNIQQFTILPGIVTYDYQTITHVNMFINAESDRFILNAGTPMVHMIPLTDKKVVYKHHLVDEDEWTKIGIPYEFSKILPGRYNRYVAESKKTSKCPFGFSK
jgi:hypothetical protein